MGHFSEQHLEHQYADDCTFCPPELELFFHIENLYDRYEELEWKRVPPDDSGEYYTDEQIHLIPPEQLRNRSAVRQAIETAEARFKEYGLEYSEQMPGESRGQWVRRVVLGEDPDEFVQEEQDVFPAA